MLRNSVKNGNILADCSAQLELLPFSFVDVAEEMPLWFCLQHEIEELRGAQILIEDTIRRIMSHKDVKIIGDVFIGNPGIPGDRTDDYTVTILYGILQNGNAGILELSGDAISLVQIESQFMIAGNKEFPFGRERPKPGNEVIILTAFKIILHGITGTNYNIRILRHLQATMAAVSVGECEDLMNASKDKLQAFYYSQTG